MKQSEEFFPIQTDGLNGATDAELRAAVDAAEIVPLLCSIALLTNDDGVLDRKFRPNTDLPPGGPQAHCGLSEASVNEARGLAFRHLRELRDAGDISQQTVVPTTLERTIAFVTQDQHEPLRSLISRELDIPSDSEAPSWQIDKVSPGRAFRVAVIGAGMSGILTAYRLRQAGIEFEIFEKNPEVGGTWHANSYPGCRLDTPNFAYSYSFAQNPYWPNEFSKRDPILSYFETLTSRFELRERLHLNTEMLKAQYDEDQNIWKLQIRGPQGLVSDQEFNAVISAVGQLNRPNIPKFPGIDSFGGDAWHTAEWNHSVNLNGKRVGVIGSGASAYQVVPAILEQVGSMTIFQRNPPWMLPTPAYYDPISSPHGWLLSRLPHYAKWVRFIQFWIAVQGRLDLVRVDPAFEHPVSVSADNESLRQALTRHLEMRYEDRPDLLATQTPNYPPGAKRMLRDNGVWSAALKDPRTHLELQAIDSITSSGIRMKDGSEHELDVIIYATGFRAADFLVPMEIIGKNGLELHDSWQGDARAYLGMCVPEFPNFFCMYGPNTNLVVHGSLVIFAESSANYIMECLRLLLEKGSGALSVTDDAFNAFNELIDRENEMMAWGASGVSSWYKNDTGRVSQNWPLPLKDFVLMTEQPDPDHFRFYPLHDEQ